MLDGCLLWGSRAAVPPARRSLNMDEHHDTHPGISIMKERHNDDCTGSANPSGITATATAE